MNATVTNEGLLIPKEWLYGFGDIEIHREGRFIVIMPVKLPEAVIKPSTVANQPPSKLFPKLNSFAWSEWPIDSTFRREELYDDNGR